MQSQFDITRNHSTRKFNHEAWRFGVQVFFSGTVLALCIFKIAVPSDSDDKNIALYWGGLSSVLAYWLPSPGQNREDKEQMSSSLMAVNKTNNTNDSLALVAENTTTKEHQS